MVSREGSILAVYTLLEEHALDVLKSRRYDRLLLETRMLIYEEKRKAAKVMASSFGEAKEKIDEIKIRYDSKGRIVGHRLFDRFSHRLPDYLR